MTDKKAILSILTALAISVSASCPIAAAGDEDTNVLAHFDFDSASLDGNFGTAEAVGNLTYEDTAGGEMRGAIRQRIYKADKHRQTCRKR